MNVINFLILAGALLLALFLSPPSQADESCIKLVLNSYCLGGEPPAGTTADASGVVVVDNARGEVSLTVKDNRVVAIERTMTPANWLSFNALKVKLVRVYRTAEDKSNFPSYATSRSSKLNAIRAGRGHAAARWQLPGWNVQLLWKSLDEMKLRYEIDDHANSAESSNTPEGL